MPDITALPALLQQVPNLRGLNVTVPHKQNVIPYLDEIEAEAQKIGAVNVIKLENGQAIGYNSDYQGFMQSLQKFYPTHSSLQALVLGNGGAAKAVMAALENLNIIYKLVSRTPQAGQLHYQDLTEEVLVSHTLIINTTPLGTYPQVDTCPDIPYKFLSENHYLFDLVYNPAETLFLRKGREAGAQTKNGYEMLVLQAEISWQIWNI